MKAVLLKEVKKGGFFHFQNSVTSPLWVRSVYDRSTKMFEIYRYDNVNDFHFHFGSRLVYVEE